MHSYKLLIIRPRLHQIHIQLYHPIVQHQPRIIYNANPQNNPQNPQPAPDSPYLLRSHLRRHPQNFPWKGPIHRCQEEWARMTFQYLRVKVVELTGNRPLSNGKVMVYANHRSQADFFLHNVLLDFKTNFLSRMAVLLASPNFIVSYKTVWFFNRGQRLHPQKFNEWLDYKYERSPRPALLVYPEGHRMQGFHKADPMMLKTGMFKYAYRRKMPAQILITFGNEDIFDEKRLHVAFNQTVYYKLSQVIEASDFETENEYIAEVKQRFCQLFDETYEQYTQAKQRGLRREENMRMAPRTI